MQDWQSQFEAMRSSFLARAGARLDRIDVLLESLALTPEDQQVLSELRQHFHWLCGAGGTYKLPGVSDLGWEGEELCDRLAETSAFPCASEVAYMQNILKDVRALFKAVNIA